MPVPRSADFVSFAPGLFVLLWSTGFVGARFGLPYAEPFTFLLLHYGIVGVLLASVIVVLRLPLPRTPALWGHLAVSGLLLHGFYIAGVFIAIARGMPTGIAALIVGVQPLLTAVLARGLLGEIVSRLQWAGLALGFVGLAMTVTGSAARGELPAAGVLSCTVALLAITGGTLYQKRFVQGVDLRVGTCVQFLVTAAGFLVLAMIFDHGAVTWHPRFVFALAWLCLVLSLGATSLLWILIARGAASRVASLFYLVPPVTAVEGFLLFDETLTTIQWLGIALTAGGVALVNRR